MKIAVVGLGRMGMQVAHKLVVDGHGVLAHNRSQSKIDEAVGFGALAAPSKASVIEAFQGGSVTLWLMLPADVVEHELTEWLSLLPLGSTIIDGGNSDYRLTQTRASRAATAGHNFVDVGTSGGILGLRYGFSLMVGGETSAVTPLLPLFETLSKPTGSYAHLGPSGAGHFTKMVHNAVEYGLMESYAEGYQLLKEGPYAHLNLAEIGKVWQHGSIVSSRLNALAIQALEENPDLHDVPGPVAESGEAGWALETAAAHNLAMPAVEAARSIRLASQQGNTSFATKLLASLRARFGGHSIEGK